MEAKSSYEQMANIHAKTTPLAKEQLPYEPNVECVDPFSDQYIEDRSQIELEVEIEKKGIPIIDVERPPIPKIRTDKTRYKKITVSRKSKKSDKNNDKDKEYTLNEDREMKAFAETLKIPKKKRFLLELLKKLYDLYCKINKFCLNIQRKIFIKKKKPLSNLHEMPAGIKRKNLAEVQPSDLQELGRQRGFQRKEDDTPNMIQAIRNKKTGVVVMIPQVSQYRKEVKSPEDFEVVESQIKEVKDEGVCLHHPTSSGRLCKKDFYQRDRVGNSYNVSKEDRVPTE